METIKLRRPLLVNGRELTELSCDLDAISSDQFIKAEQVAKSKLDNLMVNVVEGDYGFHLELGFAAIMAADPSIDQSDLDRITGQDLIEIMRVGRNFIGDSSESQDEATSESEESACDQPSESTATSTETARAK